MADGQFRFSQAPGQPFYPQYSHHNPRHLQQRPTSPANTSRRGFNTDTPSPSRSPRPRSPSNIAYSMYGTNHAAINQHGLLNGASHQRFGNQLNLNKPFSHHNPHQHNHHGQQTQDHGTHATHQPNFVSHQHNQSGGGVSNTVGHFTPQHAQNGTPNNTYSAPGKVHGEHWQKQLEIATEVRQLTTAHPHARNASSASKANVSATSNGLTKDSEREDHRYRTAGEATDVDGESSIWTEMDLGGSNLRALSLELFDYYPFLTKLYLNNNKLIRVPPLVGRLRNLTYMDLSLNRITELPGEMGMLVNLKSLLLIDNQIEIIPYEMGNLFQLEMLAIDGNPLNESQRSIIAEEGTAALIRTLRESAPGPETPNERDWITLDDTPYPDGEKFSVLTFNILCKQAGTQAQFGYTPLHALSWDQRKGMILDEIRGRNADIVCLQEMDVDNYHNLFRETLAHNDYKGVYWPRTRSKTMSDTQSKMVDGCATFVKNSKYIILDKQFIDFGQIALNRQDMKGEHDVYNRIMIRDHIAVVTFLENRQTGSRLIVVNTHIFWDQVYRDVKVVQVSILMEETQKLAEKYAKWPPTPAKDKILYRFANGDKADGEDAEEVVQEPVPSMEYARATEIPFILCGDFNSTPRSGVYNLITTGQLPGNHQDFGSYKYGDLTKHGVRHPFSLKSSYGAIGELPFTNYTPGFRGVLDYIMYSTPSLQVTALLGQVDPEYLERVPGFPNVHYPSDHLSLLSQFVVKGKKERKVTEVDFGPQKERRHA